MSILVDHARRELELIGEDPETINGFVKIVEAFDEMGHSGGSASIAIPMITQLLELQNLTPLTDNPDEWHHHEDDGTGSHDFWQNKRNGEAFSYDGGKTYYLLSEGGNARNQPQRWHNSRSYDELKRVREADDN